MNKDTKNIPKKIADYTKEKGNEFDYMFFLKFVNNKDTIFFKQGWEDMMDSPETDFCPEIEEVVGEHKVFIKDTRSCLRNEKFLKFLKDNNVEELYLCGLNTNECILSNAYDGIDCGFNVFVIKDLVQTFFGQENHKTALKILENIVEVI